MKERSAYNLQPLIFDQVGMVTVGLIIAFGTVVALVVFAIVFTR